MEEGRKKRKKRKSKRKRASYMGEQAGVRTRSDGNRTPRQHGTKYMIRDVKINEFCISGMNHHYFLECVNHIKLSCKA